MRLKEGGVLLLNLSKSRLFSRKSTFRQSFNSAGVHPLSVSFHEMNAQRQLKQPESFVWAAHISKLYLKVVAYVTGDSEDCCSILEHRVELLRRGAPEQYRATKDWHAVLKFSSDL